MYTIDNLAPIYHYFSKIINSKVFLKAIFSVFELIWHVIEEFWPFNIPIVIGESILLKINFHTMHAQLIVI